MNKAYEKDIRKINKIRKELGKNPLPVKNNKWYDVVLSTADTYTNKELAIKMIAADLTPYTAQKYNKQNANTSKAQLRKRVQTQHGRFSLDEVIRNNSIQAFESNQYEQMNVTQETLLEQGQLSFDDAGTVLVETSLSSTSKVKNKGRRKIK